MRERVHRRPNRLIYILVTQLGWFACVLGAARGIGWIGVIFALAALSYHFLQADRPAQEFKLLLATVMLGGIWETAVVRSGVLVYPNGMLLPGTAPYWILALWALFGMQLNVLFGWLKTRLVLAAVLGAIAGPLSFRAGAALGAVRFPQLIPALTTLAVGWGLLLPGLLVLARRWDGFRAKT